MLDPFAGVDEGPAVRRGEFDMRDRLRVILPLLLVALLSVTLLVACDNQGQQQGGGDGGQEGQEGEQQGLQLDVVEQWAQSGHANAIAFAAEEEGCQNCHDGLTFAQTGGGFQPRMNVQLPTGQGEETTGGAEAEESTEGAESEGTTGGAEAEEAEPEGGEGEQRDWVVATDCRACHIGAGVQIAEEGSVEGIPNLETAEGGTGALCMACHNGWHPPGEGREGNLAAPHYSTQTDMLFGVNTLEVGGGGGGAGETTGTGEATGTQDATGNAEGGEEERVSPHAEVEDTCVGCHVAGGDDPGHLFSIENYDSCSQEGCHEGDMTDGGQAEEDFDGDGQTENVTQEVEGLMQTLENAINEAAGSTSFASEQGDVVFEGGGRVSADDPAYQAAYNYLYVEKDGSRGIHNTQFTVQLLQDSIAGVSQ